MNSNTILRFVLMICVILLASLFVAADIVLDVTKYPTAHPGETVTVRSTFQIIPVSSV